MKPILSIIIPCYNTEATLEVTLQSILNQEFQEWEAIIVNDGSPDNLEQIALKYKETDSRIIYFKKKNGGLGSARNYGIEKAKGKYILPLDSDNKIEKSFALEAITIFNNDNSIGVIYGDAEFFGEKSGFWHIGEYNLDKMLVDNYIDACAIYKKTLWQLVGGYDENMPYQGHEDWEFWIALGIKNTKFYYLNKKTFEYFVSNNSMIRSQTASMKEANTDYIVKKYSEFYYKVYCKNLFALTEVKSKFEAQKLNYENNLKSEKFVTNAFTKIFLGFEFFKIKV